MPTQGQWTSNTVHYTDPKYEADMRVKMHGTFVAEVAEGKTLSQPVEELLAQHITPILGELFPKIHYADFPAKRAEIATTIKDRLATPLGELGVTLSALDISGEIYQNQGFFAGFISKAGPVLVLAGLASIVLYFLGLNLKILAWIDVWGPTVGWALRIGAVVLGAALTFLSFKLNSGDD